MRFEDDENIVWSGWNPTDAQLARYRAREHELARYNLSFLFRMHGTDAVKPSNTLHSDEVFFHAFQAELAQ